MTGEIVQIKTRTYEVDRKAYIAATWSRRFFPRLMPILAIVAFVDAYFAFTSNLATTVAVVIASFLTIAILYPFRLYFFVRRMATSPNNRAMFSERTVFFTDVDIVIAQSNGGESRIPWTSVQFAERRKNFTLLFVSSLLCLPVPDDAFLNDHDRAKFYTLVTRHIKWQGKSLSPG